MLAGVPSGAGQYRFVRVVRVLIFPGAWSCVGFVLAAKRQVIPRSQGTYPEPAVPAWAHGTNGVGPALLSPDGAPVRWLLIDSYIYDIRHDQDHSPGRKAAGRQRMASADLARNARQPDEETRQPDGGDMTPGEKHSTPPVSEPSADTAAVICMGLWRSHL